MMTFNKLTAAIALVTLSALPAHAQRKDYAAGFYIGGELMLINKGVQEELKVSPEQAATLGPLVVDVFSKLRAVDRGNRDLPNDERQQKIRDLAQTLLPELHEKVATILSPDQIKRFAQIQIQERGIAAYNNSRAQEMLKLTDEQQTKIKALYTEMAQNINTLLENRRATGEDPDEASKKASEFKKQAAAAARALLTESQKATLKEMMGEPFEVDQERPSF